MSASSVIAMSPLIESLQSGLEAIREARYLEAIDLLESYCYAVDQDLLNPEAKCNSCLLAQIFLVKAYLGSGDLERALALCQLVSESEHPQVKAWAQQALPILYTEELQQNLPQQQRICLELPPLSDLPLDPSLQKLCNLALDPQPL